MLPDALERGWRELADEDLEAHALAVFARRFADLGDEDRAALAEAVRAGPRPLRHRLRGHRRAARVAAGATREAVGAVDGRREGADPLEAATSSATPT